MKYNPKIHHRNSIRLKDYDYARHGAYFLTMVPQNRECLFGEINNDEIELNDAGKIVFDEWQNTVNMHYNVSID